MEAVLVQLYNIASSPKAFPGPMWPSTLSSLITSKSPLAETNKCTPASPSRTTYDPAEYSFEYMESTISRTWEVSKFFKKSLSIIASLMSCLDLQEINFSTLKSLIHAPVYLKSLSCLAIVISLAWVEDSLDSAETPCFFRILLFVRDCWLCGARLAIACFSWILPRMSSWFCLNLAVCWRTLCKRDVTLTFTSIQIRN